MSNPFLSSEEYDERAHALYNEGRYDEALALLREALVVYPSAVELHVGAGYARLARDEYAWARRAFEEALTLDSEHEDALAGLGEVLLKFGQVEAGFRAFARTVELGYDDDIELMLQIGRALFREGFVETALEYFERAVGQAPDNAEAVACVGYAQHRLGLDDDAMTTLQRALELDSDFAEARVYLANLLYDAGDMDGALRAFERTTPEDHWDDLGILRALELKKTVYRLSDDDPELKPWEARLIDLAGEPDAVDELLAEVEQAVLEREHAEQQQAHGQLEQLGSLLNELQHTRPDDETAGALLDTLGAGAQMVDSTTHRIVLRDGQVFEGTWEAIVQALRDRHDAGRPLDEFMAREARRTYGATGQRVASHAPEAFIRGNADAGMWQLDR